MPWRRTCSDVFLLRCTEVAAVEDEISLETGALMSSTPPVGNEVQADSAQTMDLLCNEVAQKVL